MTASALMVDSRYNNEQDLLLEHGVRLHWSYEMMGSNVSDEKSHLGRSFHQRGLPRLPRTPESVRLPSKFASVVLGSKGFPVVKPTVYGSILESFPYSIHLNDKVDISMRTGNSLSIAKTIERRF